MTQGQKQKLLTLLNTYGKAAFATAERPWGRTNAGHHHIETVADKGPVRHGLRPTSPKEKEVIRNEVKKMLEQGAIRPSSSPWSSPIVLVKKKDGSVRFCIDYRKVNDITIKDVFPLPRTTDLLESFHGAKIFSTLDAAAGYWQVPLSEESIPKSAFICPEGLFEFLVMPFGLCNAPATYQRIMNVLLAGVNGISCLVYLDDIIVFSKDFDSHLHDLAEVLDRLMDAEILLKPSKCKFGVNRVEYLGHIVSDKGIAPDPRKLEKLWNFPRPKSVVDVRSFLGFAGYYRKFVRNFAIIAEPLFDLLKKDHEFIWLEAHEQAFQVLIKAIAKDAVLAHPQFDKPFIVDTDACDTGIAGVLSQNIDGKERPIAFVSRHLAPGEQKWHIREKEALGIVWTLESFRHFLLGSSFHVRTDHSSLTWFLSAAKGRLGRWALKLKEFAPFQIVHRAGKAHTNVDALSRYIPESDTFPDRAFCTLMTSIKPLPDRETFINAQATDPTCREALKRLLQKESPFCTAEGVLAINVPNGIRILLPESLQDEVIRGYHENPTQGHMGIAKTTKKVLEKFHFPYAKRKVTEVLQKCLPCKQRKQLKQHHIRLSSRPSSKPWSTVAADFCGPYNSGAGNRYVLVIVDHFTKWVELIPTKTQDAIEVAQAFYDRIICHFGCPNRFLTDQGSSFKSKLIETICGLFRIKKIFSSTYFPQGDGTAERFMRSMNNSLSILSRHHPTMWPKYVQGVAFAYNTSVHASTGYSPFFLNTGRVPSFPEEGWIKDFGKDHEMDVRSGEYQDYIQGLKETIEHAKAHAQRCMENAWIAMSQKYKLDSSNIQVGDKVLIRLNDFERNQFPIRKLAPRWSEPATVESVLTNGKTYRVKRGDSTLSVNRERLVKLAPKTNISDSYKPSMLKRRTEEKAGAYEPWEESEDDEWMLVSQPTRELPAPLVLDTHAEQTDVGQNDSRMAKSRASGSNSSEGEVIVSISSDTSPLTLSSVYLDSSDMREETSSSSSSF